MDTKDAADLWKEGLFGRKMTRFICFSKNRNEERPDHMVHAIQIINDKDSIPHSFVAIEETVDTYQKAFKKKLLCVKYAHLSDNVESIVDIVLLSKSGSPPLGYEDVGEISGMHIVVKKISAITRLSPQLSDGLSPAVGNWANTSWVYPRLENSFSKLSTDSSSSTFSTNGNYPVGPYPIKSTPVSNYSTLSSQYSGLDGIPFVLRDELTNSGGGKKAMVRTFWSCLPHSLLI